jgi:hypothetical protein
MGAHVTPGYGFGERSRFGKHTPGGVRKGVRRSNQAAGHIMYNGHRHTPDRTARLVLDFMARLGRPTTSIEVAAALNYTPKHAARVMYDMLRDGAPLVRSQKRAERRGYFIWSLADLPDTEPDTRRKVCSKCREDLPWDAFGADRKQPSGIRPDCKRCRSRRPELYRPYPSRQEVS